MTSKDRIEKQSIINNEYRCYICGSPVNLDLHHCISGSYRKLADEDNLFLALCHYHHKKLHDTGENDKELKALAERSYIKKKMDEGYTEGQARGIWLNRYNKHWV